MFERYTERAKRVLFYSRYEATEIGGRTIETEHLLLGLLREGKGVTSQIFARAELSHEIVRQRIASAMGERERMPASVEIPFSKETKRILSQAAEEADTLGHSHIGSEHLLLAVLHEPESVAGKLLHEAGLEVELVRQEIVAAARGI